MLGFERNREYDSNGREPQAATIRRGEILTVATLYILCTSPIKIDLCMAYERDKENKEKQREYMTRLHVREHGAPCASISFNVS